LTIKSTIRGYAADVARAFDRAPVECILSFAIAAFLSYALEDGDLGVEVPHVAAAAGLVAAAAWSATLAFAMRSITLRTRWIITLAGAGIGAAYLASTDLEYASEGWRALMLAIAAASLVFAVPAFAPRARVTGDNNLRLRRVNARFLLRALGIGLYGIALFAGLAVALAAVDNLFELKIHGRIYGHVFIWIMLVLVPWVIVGGLDDYVRPIDEESDIARVVKRLATFLVPPLVAIYYLILCAYIIRIAITHELPRNLVSPMVLAAGLLSCIALILFDPAPDDHLGMRWLRYTPVAFIPLSAVGWWALAARTSAFGWTEFRIIRALSIAILLALALAAAFCLMRRQRFALRSIPALIGVVFALASVGPWSVLAFARRNQQHRLAAALADARVDARIVARKDSMPRRIPLREYTRITGAANYLESNFGAKSVAAVVSGYTDRDRSGGLVTALAIMPDKYDTINVQRNTWASLPANRLIAVPAGGMVRMEVDGPRNRRGNAPANSNAWVSHDTAFVAFGADTTAILLKPVWNVIATRGGEAEIPSAGAALSAFDRRTGASRGYLTVLNISWEMDKGERSVMHLSGILMMPNRNQAPSSADK
jgi:hypothetical protein